MSNHGPRLFADERGVWRTTKDRSTGIRWDEVYRVTAYKLDGITEIYTCVNLDWEYGEFIEFYHDWPGFEQVVSEITAKLAGIDTNWFQKVQQSSISDPPAEVWCRLDLTL